MAPTKCAYFMCNNTSDQKPMFRFPSADPTRLQVWLSNCGNMTITHLSHNELRNRYLCLEHFDEKFVQNQGGRRTRITKKALPKHYKEEENMAISPHSPIPSSSEGYLYCSSNNESLWQQSRDKCELPRFVPCKMYTSVQLKDFLKEISEEAKFIKFEYDSPEKFNVLIKCKVEENQPADYYKEHAKNWINQFSYFTKTAWVVRICYPAVKCFVFRKTYACHLGASTGKQQARNMHCKAAINFKITNNGNDAVVKDPHFQEGLNMTIAIECEHSHSIKVLNVVNLKKVCSYNKSAFYEFFDEGYTAMAASCYNVLRLMDMYGPDSEKLADYNFNPTIQRIQYLYSRRWNRKEINVNEVMIKKMQTLEKIGHTIKYNDNPPYVVIMTPLMKRVIAHIGLQRVLIDATLDHGAPFTLVLYVPSMIGSLPVACATFTELNKEIYLQIFLTVKIAIQTLTGINFEPKVLLHDDDSMIKEALTLVFPNSIIILNRYSLCKDFWRWICDDGIVIKPEPLSTIVLIKSLIFTKSLNEAMLVHDILISRSLPDKCLDKINFIWVNRKQWIDDNQLCDGFNDAIINFTKEFILELCKPFKDILPAMLDVVTNVIESHYNKILQAHRDGNVMSVYSKFIAKTKIDINSEYVRKVDTDEYHIQDGLNRGQVQQINIDTMCCDCSLGKIGRICDHLCALLMLNDDKFALFSSLDYNERNIFLKILGDTSTTIKSEDINDLQIEETAIDDERPRSCLSSMESEENYNPEIKKEVQDSLETNHEDENIAHDSSIKMEDQDCSETYYEDENSVNINFASEDTPQTELKEQYEACMKCVNEEFQRLEKLFKEHPNETNLYTMQRLTKELAKIVVVKEEVDLSNMYVTLNNKTSVTEEI
ncbi:uncharacterized protein [Choristoneura fumiferana]|uniref:uncharacterized protein n=1 Tax=Choristoneura fumiferana TaxID=7141 RepID=UPI003D15773F